MSSYSALIKILLVDDDSALMEMLAETLSTALKAAVMTAASVPAALAAIDDKGPFSVIVSDYQMPPHTALDLAGHMRAAYNKTPFIIHSSFTGVDEAQFAGESYLGLVSKTETKQLVKLIGERFPEALKK